MFDIIENYLPQGPRWQSTSITLPDAPDEPQEFYHRDIIECTKFLFGDPSFTGDMLYSAVEQFEFRKDEPVENCEGLNRIYCEMNSADLWVEEEVCYTTTYSDQLTDVFVEEASQTHDTQYYHSRIR
jgi:Plavaka transposase